MGPDSLGWVTILLGGSIVVTAVLHFLLVARLRPVFGPETYFLAMAAGTFFATAESALGGGSTSALVYANFIGAGTLSFLLGTVTASMLLRFDHAEELAAFNVRPWRDDLVQVKRTAVLAVGVLAALVTGLYFYELGTFVPWEALKALLAAGPVAMVDTYNAARAETRVGVYLGLGYVKQFKDCLLPLITLLFLVKIRMRPERATAWWLALFGLATVSASVGTGSRFALAAVGALLCIVGLAPYVGAFRFSRREAAIVVLCALLGLSVLTLMMGPRGQDVPFGGTPFWAPYQVIERVFISPAQERLLVFELFLNDAAPQWGAGALQTLRLALPGRAEYTLPNQLHELLYGNAFGNVGLDAWGSLWYDWQWGGLLVAFLLGGLFHAFYVWLLRGPKKLIRIIALTHAGFILGLATDLQVLLLQGFATVLLFLVLVEIVGIVPGSRD